MTIVWGGNFRGKIIHHDELSHFSPSHVVNNFFNSFHFSSFPSLSNPLLHVNTRQKGYDSSSTKKISTASHEKYCYIVFTIRFMPMNILELFNHLGVMCVCCMSSDFPPSLIFCVLFKLIKFDNTQSSFKNNDFCPHLDVPQLIKCLLTFSPLICYKSVKLRNLIWLFFVWNCECVNDKSM